MLNLPWVFLFFTFIIDFFLLLTFLNINGKLTLQTSFCFVIEIPQQCLPSRLDVLVYFELIFALFLGAFFVEFEYYLLTYRNRIFYILFYFIMF